MTKFSLAVKKEWAILLILVAAFILRAWNLTTQSLWLDELHNMNEADPALPWSEMFFHLKCCDQHPPLYFIVERLAFTFFGHTEFVARIISVLAGTASVWAMWLLGKEINGRGLGYLAALLTTVNYYNIYYSQEARGYIFAFLFAALSFLYFIRLVKEPVRKNSILYAVFTLLFLYSHYFSLFTVVAQGILALIFIFQEEKGPARGKLFKGFLVGGIIVAVGYAPWLPYLLEMSNIQSFWIGEVKHDFLISFFKEYFGYADTIVPIIVVLLAVYMIHVWVAAKKQGFRNLKQLPVQFSFVIVTVWVFISYLIPYLRSVLVVPMLYPRYTIVVLPAILLAAAYGIESFRVRFLQYLITAAIVFFALNHLIKKQHFYTGIRKSQFREMTQYVVEENQANYPIINQVTAWHQGYYLKKFGSKAPLLTGNKEALVDSILTKSSPAWDLRAFWMVGAHGDAPVTGDVSKKLLENYILLKERRFYDAWAQLYVLKTDQNNPRR